MIRTEDKTHGVRNEQAYVADCAAYGHSEAGKDGSGDVNNDLHAVNIDAEMHSLFFAGEEKVEVRCGGVDRAGGNQESDTEEIEKAFRRQGGEATHQPVGIATQIATRERGHQKHHDRRKEG